MPNGWWTDPQMIEAGRKIFQEGFLLDDGKIQKCANCHGQDAKPSLKDALDFRKSEVVDRFTDSYWFWRVSEGVPRTKMRAWGRYLTEAQRWQVIAYEHRFSHGGKAATHDHGVSGSDGGR